VKELDEKNRKLEKRIAKLEETLNEDLTLRLEILEGK
jgi:hypothetical protein